MKMIIIITELNSLTYWIRYQVMKMMMMMIIMVSVILIKDHQRKIIRILTKEILLLNITTEMTNNKN